MTATASAPNYPPQLTVPKYIAFLRDQQAYLAGWIAQEANPEKRDVFLAAHCIFEHDAQTIAELNRRCTALTEALFNGPQRVLDSVLRPAEPTHKTITIARPDGSELHAVVTEQQGH